MSETIEFKIKLPMGAEKEFIVSVEDLIKNLEMALKFSLAQKIVEKKGLDKEVGNKISDEIRKGVTKRLGL